MTHLQASRPRKSVDTAYPFSFSLYGTLSSTAIIYTIAFLHTEFTIKIFKPNSLLFGDTKSRKP